MTSSLRLVVAAAAAALATTTAAASLVNLIVNGDFQAGFSG